MRKYSDHECVFCFYFTLLLFYLTIAIPVPPDPEPTEGTKSYQGYRLLTVIPRTESAGRFLAKLANTQKEALIDFWQEPRMLYHNVTFSVAPVIYEDMLEMLMSEGMIPHIISDNLQEMLDAERKQLGLSRKKRAILDVKDFKVDQYNRHPEINAYIDLLDKTCDICEKQTVGYSHEGRELKLIKIGKNSSAPGIFIDAGIHAREWIAPATAMYIINELLDIYSNPHSQWLIKTFNWYILPIVNPDGYEYSFDHDRLWRKSRSSHVNNECTGTDLNRNFDFHWREIGASTSSCASNYAGPYAFSEPESRALSAYLSDNSHSLIGYVTLHSYGQYWLTPWGFTSTLPGDYNHLSNIAAKATLALRRVSQRYYMVTSTNFKYWASGGSSDWAKGVCKIRYTYTVELRGPIPAYRRLRYAGFMLPTTAIQPQGEEMWAALRAMAREIYAVGGDPQPANIEL